MAKKNFVKADRFPGLGMDQLDSLLAGPGGSTEARPCSPGSPGQCWVRWEGAEPDAGEWPGHGSVSGK